MSTNCLVAMYHYVRDTTRTPYPGLNALAPCDFEAQLDAIARARHFIPYADFERTILDQQPFAEPVALLTFDDGFVDHYEVVLPRLQERKVSGVFFLAGASLDDPPRVLNVHKTHFLIEKLGDAGFAEVLRLALSEQPVVIDAGLLRWPDVYRYDGEQRYTQLKHLLNYELPYEMVDVLLRKLFAAHIGDESKFARELYLSLDQIREMANANMTFGFHTEQHRVLSRLSAKAQQKEIHRGIDRIRTLTGQVLIPFCYPYGHPQTYTEATVGTVRESGYTTAFTTTRRAADAVVDEPLKLPRYDTRDLPPFTACIPHA